jgi:hypothetical protein
MHLAGGAPALDLSPVEPFEAERRRALCLSRQRMVSPMVSVQVTATSATACVVSLDSKRSRT